MSVADTALAQRIATERGLYATVAELGRLLVTGKDADLHPEPLVRALIHAGADVREVRVRTPSLEDVFFAVAQPKGRAA